MRTCSRCGKEKPATKVHFQSNGKGGLRADCKECFSKWRSERWHSLPNDKREEILSRGRDRCAEWYQNNTQRHRDKNREWLAANAGKRRQAARLWIDLHRDLAREYARRFASKARQCSKTRASQSVSKRVAESLKGRKGGASWQKVVGYSREQLVAHLERQFVSGMNWANYGRAWHIDHIVPIAAFSFASVSDPEFKACWALSNLRPLFAAENCSKGAKRLFLL